MQIMPHTQEELGLIDPFDPRANVYAGSQYLMHQLQRFGSVELALAAYNAGPGSVEQYGGIPPFLKRRNSSGASWSTGTGTFLRTSRRILKNRRGGSPCCRLSSPLPAFMLTRGRHKPRRPGASAEPFRR